MRRAGWPVLIALAVGTAFGTSVSACVKGAPAPDTRKDEIMALWTQIRDWRVDKGLPPDPIFKMPPDTVKKARAICPQDPSITACDDVCDLADAICDNAERICDLASELNGDSWAHDKCVSAIKSCAESKQRCCSCDDQAARETLRGFDDEEPNREN